MNKTATSLIAAASMVLGAGGAVLAVSPKSPTPKTQQPHPKVELKCPDAGRCLAFELIEVPLSKDK